MPSVPQPRRTTLAIAFSMACGLQLPGQSPQLVPFGSGFPALAGPAPQINVRGHLLAGATVDLVITGGPAATGGYVAIGPFSASPPAWLGAAPFYFQSLPQLLGASLDNTGSATIGPIPIPVTTTLVGVELNAQAVLFDPGLASGIRTSRGLRARVGRAQPGPRYPRTLIPLPAAIRSARGVDLNGDGEDDLIGVADGSGDAVVMVSGSRGEPGTPQTVNLMPATLGPGRTQIASLAVGDMNGDGVPDLIATNGANEISWAEGDGAGGFLPPNTTTYPSTAALGNTVAADMNGDGRVEVFVVDDPTSNQPQLLGFDNPGSGTLTLAAATPLPGQTRELRCGDLNNDGVQDLVGRHLIQGGPDEVLVLLGGAGGLGGPIQVPLPGSGDHLSVADLDGDGHDDVAVDCAQFPVNDLLVLYGGPQGVDLTTPPSALPLPTNYDVADLLLADVESDGTTEVLCSDGGLIREILIHRSGPGPRTFSTPQRIGQGRTAVQLAAMESQLYGGTGLVLIRGAEVMFLLPTTQGARSDVWIRGVTDGARIAHCGDVDGNDVPDLLLFVDAAGNTRRLDLLTGNGDGTFAAAQTLAGIPNSARDVAVADLDGDGDQDVAAAVPGITPSVVLLINQGNGVFTQSPSIQLTPRAISGSPVATVPMAIRALDLNGDRLPELVLATAQPQEIRPIRNNGALGFTEEPAIALAAEPGLVEAADVDGDGHADVLVGHRLLASMEVLGNGPAGQGGTGLGGLLTAPVQVSLPFPPYDLEVTDLDRDGRPDVFAAEATGLFFPLHVLPGTGALSPASAIPLPTPAGSGRIAFADVTGDRMPELITGSVDVLGSLLHVQELAVPQLAQFSPPTSLSLGDLNRGTTSLAIADLDQDGLPDVVTVAGVPAQPPGAGQVALRVFLHQRGGRK